MTRALANRNAEEGEYDQRTWTKWHER